MTFPLKKNKTYLQYTLNADMPLRGSKLFLSYSSLHVCSSVLVSITRMLLFLPLCTAFKHWGCLSQTSRRGCCPDPWGRSIQGYLDPPTHSNIKTITLLMTLSGAQIEMQMQSIWRCPEKLNLLLFRWKGFSFSFDEYRTSKPWSPTNMWVHPIIDRLCRNTNWKRGKVARLPKSDCLPWDAPPSTCQSL